MNHGGSSYSGKARGLRRGRDTLLSLFKGTRRGSKQSEGALHKGMMKVRKQEADVPLFYLSLQVAWSDMTASKISALEMSSISSFYFWGSKS